MNTGTIIKVWDYIREHYRDTLPHSPLSTKKSRRLSMMSVHLRTQSAVAIATFRAGLGFQV